MRKRLAVLLLAGLWAPPSTASLLGRSEPDGRIREKPQIEGTIFRIDLTERSARAAVAREFMSRQGGHWRFAYDPRSGRPARVKGSGIPLIPGAGNRLDQGVLAGLPLDRGQVSLETLEPLVREFIDGPAAGLLAPHRGVLELDGRRSSIRDAGRLASLYFDWIVDGVPVEGASVYVWINSGNITQFGAPWIVEFDRDATPAIDAASAMTRLLEYSGDGSEAEVVGKPELLFQIEPQVGGVVEFRLVWRIAYRLGARVEHWEGRVDAGTGEVVVFRDLTRSVRTGGGVYGRSPSDPGQIRVPFAFTWVGIDGISVLTDTAGADPLGARPASSALYGQYFTTAGCPGCVPQVATLVSDELGFGRLDFGFGSTGVPTEAERSAYYHLNQVRRIGLKWLPGETFLDETLMILTDSQGGCDASWFSVAAVFQLAAGGCTSSGTVADVAYHEWGHGIDENTSGGDAALGEGKGDVVSMLMTRSAGVGIGFFSATDDPVRNLDSTTSPHGLLTRTNAGSSCPTGPGPQGLEVHCEGEIFGQAAWDLAQALVAKHGHETGWRLAERLFFISLPDSGGYLPTSTLPTYDAYLNADDDDGNLANGTPNAQEIYDAFHLHEIANAQEPSSVPCARPDQPVVQVLPGCDSFDLSWNAVPGATAYQVQRGEVLSDGPLYPIADLPAGQTSYVDTKIAADVDYRYVVMAVAAGCESCVESPIAVRATAHPELSVVDVSVDDTPFGNRSGFLDPGEQIAVALTLSNFGPIDAFTVSGGLSSSTSGVTVVDAVDSWPAIGPSASSPNQGEFRFTTDAQLLACGDRLSFELVPDEASVCPAEVSAFELTLGQRIAQIHDDFETVDPGWTLGASTATGGAWERGTPTFTAFQPSADVTPGSGSNCWFTGTNPFWSNDDGDVDGGLTTLLSPVYDLSSLSRAEVSFHRWYANREPGVDPGDFFRVDVSSDGGSNWTNLESIDHTVTVPTWAKRKFLLESSALTSQVRFRFQVADGATSAGTVEAAIDEFRIGSFVCDGTAPCSVEPTFGGLQAALPGSLCGATELSWSPAVGNCPGGTITYNVYRDTAPAFVPMPANRVATGLVGTAWSDTLRVPGVTYHYVVRAEDSRSGEDPNIARLAFSVPAVPDTVAPSFAGVAAVTEGAACGETVVQWEPALESCSMPVVYEVHRSTSPGFTPGAGTLVASTFGANYVDAALVPGATYEYVVRAIDAFGNAESNLIRAGSAATIADFVYVTTDFEADGGGWQVVAPDDATEGNWEWGVPLPAPFQPDFDATTAGVNAWVTGLGTWNVFNNYDTRDVDGGATTLVSASYDLSRSIQPEARYSRRYFGATGSDGFRIDASSDGGSSWTILEQVTGEDLDPQWIPVGVPLSGAGLTNDVRLRFSVVDGDSDNYVEAGIDDFSIVEPAAGCSICVSTPDVVGTILAGRSGDDVVLDWTGDPAQTERFVVYALTGAGFADALRVGSTSVKSFVHEHGLSAEGDFYYRVSGVDSCGAEGVLQ